MSRRDAESPARNGYGEAQPAYWPGIGIDAVTAASMYCDHGESKHRSRTRVFGDSRDNTDYATD